MKALHSGQWQVYDARELANETCLRWLQDEQLSAPSRSLKVYTEALMGFSLAQNSDSLNNTSLYLKAFSFKQLLVWDCWAEHTFQV